MSRAYTLHRLDTLQRGRRGQQSLPLLSLAPRPTPEPQEGPTPAIDRPSEAALNRLRQAVGLPTSGVVAPLASASKPVAAAPDLEVLQPPPVERPPVAKIEGDLLGTLGRLEQMRARAKQRRERSGRRRRPGTETAAGPNQSSAPQLTAVGGRVDRRLEAGQGNERSAVETTERGRSEPNRRDNDGRNLGGSTTTALRRQAEKGLRDLLSPSRPTLTSKPTGREREGAVKREASSRQPDARSASPRSAPADASAAAPASHRAAPAGPQTRSVTDRLNALRGAMGLASNAPARRPEPATGSGLAPVDAVSRRLTSNGVEPAPSHDVEADPQASCGLFGPSHRTRLADKIPGYLRHTAVGPVHVVEENLAAQEIHGDRPVGALLARRAADVAVLAGDAAFAGFDPRRALFLDTECIGLGIGMGNLAFLIGAAHFNGDRLVLEQWLLRDLDDEAGALRELAERMASVDYLVTFNGRSFDLPLLQARMQVHRQSDPSGDLMHLDLLHASRRLFGHELPDCKLQTLEKTQLSFRRIDDVPGSQVPERYLHYLRGGEADGLVGVVTHNRHDIVSMVTLLDLLLERVACAESEVLRAPERGLALARLAVKCGDLGRAESIYEMAAAFPGTAAAGLKGLASVARRRKRLAKAHANPSPTR